MDVPVGTSEFKIKVTPQGGINPGLYEVEVERDSAQIFGWTPSRDISLHTDNDDATGIWSDSTTIWVADDDDDKLYAYTLATSARDTSKDISLHTDNETPKVCGRTEQPSGSQTMSTPSSTPTRWPQAPETHPRSFSRGAPSHRHLVQRGAHVGHDIERHSFSGPRLQDGPGRQPRSWHVGH